MANRPILDNGLGSIGTFPPLISTQDGKLSEQQLAYLSSAIQSLAGALNGQLSLGNGDQGTRAGNIFAQWMTVFFTTANVKVEIPHGLGKVPTDVFIGLPDKAAKFYTPDRGSWTPDLLYVTCDTSAVTARLLVF